MRKRTLGPSNVQAEPPLAPDSIPVTRYAGAVRRHLVALMVALLAGTALGVGKVALTPPTYTARISVLAPPVSLHPGYRPGRVLQERGRAPRDTTMDTEAQLIWSDEVLRRLTTFPGFDMPREELRDRIDLTVPNSTHVITIGVRAGSPQAARNGAQVVAEAYLDLRQQILGGLQQRNRESLEKYHELLHSQLRALPGDENELTRLTARTRRQEIMQQINEVQKQISALERKVVQPGEVLRAAGLPARRDDAGRDVALASGLGIGLLGWVVFTLLIARRPRRIRRPADVRLHTQLPIMVETSLGGGHREICRRLRNLVFDSDASTVLVVGVPPSAGTEVAYELAELCTEGGSATTVLEIGRDGADLPAADPEPRTFGVRRVRSDDDRQLTRAVDKAGRDSRIVIITTPDINTADTISAAAASDLTLVVVERGRALDREVAGGVLALDQAATPARGIVLTRQSPGTPDRPAGAPAPRSPARLP